MSGCILSIFTFFIAILMERNFAYFSVASQSLHMVNFYLKLFKIWVLYLLYVATDVKLEKCNKFRVEYFSTLPLSTKLERDKG